MTAPRRTLLPLLAVFAVLALAACGADGAGDDAAVPGATVEGEQLDQAARDARDEVSATLERVRGARSAEALSTELEEGAERLREQADAVEDAEAREDLEEPRDRLAAGLRRLADDFDAAAPDVAEGEWQGAAATVARGDALGEIDRALADLQAGGVDVEPLETRAEGDLDAEAQRLQGEVSALLSDLSAARSGEEAADAMETAADRLRDSADELEAAEAGAELEDARDETADATRRLADELEQAAPAVRDGDVREAAREVRAMGSLADVRRGLDELRRLGVDVESVGTSDVEEAARQARDEVDAALSELREARSTEDVADRMEEGAERIRASADDVEAAEVDPDTEAAQRQLVDGLRNLADELEQAAPDVRAGNLAQALQRAQALEAVEEIESALTELRRQGVDVPELRTR